MTKLGPAFADVTRFSEVQLRLVYNIIVDINVTRTRKLFLHQGEARQFEVPASHMENRRVIPQDFTGADSVQPNQASIGASSGRNRQVHETWEE